jgi:hypothetical protein
MFIWQIDTSGKILSAKQPISSDADAGRGIAVDRGSLYTVGFFDGKMSFNGTALTTKQGRDIFVWKQKK